MKNQKITVSIFTKKILSAFLAIALLFTLVNPLSVIKVNAIVTYWTNVSNYDTSWYGGHETDTIFSISTAAQLAGLAVLNNGLNGVTAVDFTGKTINLTANIDLTGNDWTAIGTYINDTNNKLFKGTFDGQNHTISRININKTGTEMTDSHQGLFGYSSGTIKNVGVINSSIKGHFIIGGVVGRIVSGKIENCYNEGSDISEGLAIGGVVGHVSNYFRN